MVIGVSKGEFHAQKVFSAGLAENGVDFIYNEDTSEFGVITDETKDIIASLREAIESGEIIPPASEAELEAFVYPNK